MSLEDIAYGSLNGKLSKHKTKPCDSASRLVSLLLDDGRIWDDSAETSEEIATKLNLAVRTASEKIHALVKKGTVEKVWKRINGKPVPAYRVKKS